MRILGIDYGRKKFGLAIATTILAEAYGVVRAETVDEAIEKIKRVVEKEKPERIVLGISEGRMAEETKEFGQKLQARLGQAVIFFDETLTSQEAQRLAIEAGINKAKRKELEDAYAAALMLQNYLDSHTP